MTTDSERIFSAQEFRFLVENINDLVVKVDASNRLVFVSDSYCEVFGKKRSELLGKSFMPLVHPDDQEATEKSLAEVYSPPYVCRHRQRAMTKSGWRWFEWNNRGVPDYNGVIQEIIGVGRDINDLIVAQQLLEKNQKKLEAAFDMLENIIWEVDLKTGIASYHSSMLKNIGIETNANSVADTKRVSGRIFELIHPDDQKIMAEWVYDVLRRHDTDNSLEYRFYFENRGYIWVKSKIKFIDFDSSGKPQKLLGIQYEIENDKKGAVLREQLIALLDQDVFKGPLPGLINRAEEILKHLISDFELFLSFFQGESKPFVSLESKHKFVNFHAIEEDLLRKQKPHIYIHTRSQKRKFLNEEGKQHESLPDVWVIPVYVGKSLEGFIGLYYKDASMKIDVEKLGHLVSLLQSVWVQFQYLLAEKYLYDSRIKEQEAEKLKSTFMANISHELRSPLNSIIDFSSLISRRNVNENDRHKYSEIISTSGKSLLTLVNDIIDFSKMEAGELSINISPCLVNNLLDQIYTSFLGRCEEKGLKLSLIKAVEKQFFSIDTDILRLRQIISNLLENALKFTSEGEISFGYRIVNGEIVFFVKDTGIGISESDHKSIFNTFYQVDNDTRRHFGGSGLGLAITKTLVNLLGGDIFVHSEPGRGAEFFFTIAVSVDPEAVKIGLQKLNRIDYDFDKKRILVLGTEPDECLLLHEIFKTSKAVLNCKNISKKSYDDNLQKSYEAVIYDLKSLELEEDGYLKEIVDSGLPVIIQSAIPASEHDETFMNQIDSYLVKPFEPEEMLRAVYEVFNKNR